MRSYHAEELFDSGGTLIPELAALAPRGERRMSANPHANGGLLLRDLRLPDFRRLRRAGHQRRARTMSEATRVLGGWLRDVIKANPSNFRLFGPDETESNRLGDVFEVTNRAFDGQIVPGDNHLAPDGRVMEVLSEHMCQGWLEGYLLTGRHGLFNCYEAFIHIVDSMFNQHAKWLKVTRGIGWRRPVASLNYLLSSLVWRQDHNGFSHQDPGFIDHVVNKKAEVIRVYLPPDTNTLLSVADHCLRSRQYVNVIVAGKQPQPNWLSMDDAVIHCTRGAGIWEWASNDSPGSPDVVMACCGDIPTLETLAAVSLLREHLPDAEGPGGQRGGPDAAGAGNRAPAWHVRRRVRRPVHHGQAGHLRLPRLPVAHPPADLPAARARQPACPRLQGGRHHHHAVRHGHAERPGPVPPGHGRDRPGARAGLLGRPRPAADDGQAHHVPRLHPRAGRGRARNYRLEVAVLTAILVVNAGSSSLKLRVLDDADSVVGSADLPPPRDAADADTIKAAIGPFGDLHAVGHRIVHGGNLFSGPVLIDPGVRQQLAALTDLAPLHQPKSLTALDAVQAVLPDVPAIACFDTAFHATIPDFAATFALPAEWRERWGLRRFGFHGLSHAYASRRTAEVLGSDLSALRTVSCHLGAGASLAAVQGGRSVDTTMSFTPLDGLVMATRSGSVDPGLVLWLESHAGMLEDELASALEYRSGLYGLAGTADMREILSRAAAGDARAELAREVYLHRLRGGVAAMAAAMGGLDALAFTAGVGENSAEIRSRVMAGLGFLGVSPAAEGNAAGIGDREIGRPNAPVRSLVISAREDIEIARQVRAHPALVAVCHPSAYDRVRER